MRRATVGLLLATAGAAALAWAYLDLEAARLGEAPGALARLARDAWPPETSSPEFLRALGSSLLETLAIAFLATLAGALLALPLALAAARNVAPAPLAALARLVAAAIRVLPSLLWAILAVLVFGLGPLAGLVAMTLYTVGYLGKLQYEALEGVARDPLDAVRAMGATRFQQAWHVALPEAGNAIRSQLVFMLEYNVRASSIVGLVGAGGIGQLLAVQLRFYEYGRVLTIVAALFATVSLFDLASIAARRRFVEGEGPRGRWRHLLGGRP
jgi:phosphonate transport system permease protein